MADEIKKEEAEKGPGFQDKTQVFGGAGQGEGTMKPPYLVIVDGPRKGARFRLQEGINVIGRLDECHVVLDDQSVSRKHGELNFLAEGWTIQDLQSKNGTYVNGALVQEPVVIGHKDLLRFGIYTLRFVAEPMTVEEELAIPPDLQVGEGETVVQETPSQGETGVWEARPEGASSEEGAPANKVVTAPQPPFEEEEEPLGFWNFAWLPKARLWVLMGVLFVVSLLGGLYFYWETVLSPEKAPTKKEKKIAEAKRQKKIQAIPLGPPVPEIPATIPVFLDCVANPFPAMVTFQEKVVGKTPLKINVELEPGKQQTIEARFQMEELGETYTDKLTFEVSADQSVIPLLFRAPVGTIKVVSLPRDVSMYLEAYFEYNKFEGRPIKLTHMILNKPIYAPYGRYILELRQSKAIGDPAQVIEKVVFRREFILQEENPSQLVEVTEETLQQFPAEIHSIPSGADVYVDQQKVGQTPFVGLIVVGKHTVTLRKEGYFETSQEMETDINIPYKTEITLRTSLAGEKINIAKERERQGLFAEAVQALSEVFTLTPTEHETAEARYLLGKIHIQLQDFSKAQGYFEQAKTQADFKYLAKLGLAEVLAAQGNTTQALLPLVEVLLNAKEEAVLKEGHNLLRKISPLRSVVYIQSDPAGAEVYLNDERLQQVTPVLLHEIGLGSYRIRLMKPGYQPLDLNLNLSVNEFNPVLAKLRLLPK